MLVALICFSVAPVANAITFDMTIDEVREVFGSGGDMLSGTTGYDSLALEDDGTIYFNNGAGSYGIRDNSGNIECKNEGGSWSSCQSTPIAGGGWIADGSNNVYIFPTSNVQGVPYPVVLGGTATTSAWVDTDELFINGSFTSTGAANIDGAISVAGASALVGAVTITGNSTAGGTWGVTGAVTHSSTLAQQGVATFTADPIIGGTTPTLTIGDAGAEDTSLVFDGASFDFYMGLDDNVDDLIIGKGAAVGTTPAISITDALAVTIAGTLTQTGAADLASTLNVDGAMTAAAITTDGAFVTTDDITAVNGTLSGTLAVTGVTTQTGDFAGDTNTMYMDSSANKVGFGTTTPATEWVDISDGFAIFDSTLPYDVIIHGYDSSDDGVLDLLANGTAAVQLHANGDSYFLGGGLGIGTTTPDCGIHVGDAEESTACAGDDDVYIEGTLEVDGAVDLDGAINVAGVSTLVGNVEVDGGTFVFNNTSADLDFRFEGNGEDNLLFGDGGNDRIGIATASPAYLVDIYDAATSSIRLDGVNGSCIGMTNNAGTVSHCVVNGTTFTCAAGACD